MEIGLIVSSVLLWIAVIGNALLTLALIRHANTKATADANRFTFEGLKEGTEAPSFQAQRLDGTSVTREHYRNRAFFLVFIAPHCEACEQVLPELNQIGPQFRETELVLVVDSTLEDARSMVNELGITLPVLVASKRQNPFMQDYRVRGTPAYCLVNAVGQIQAMGYLLEGNGRRLFASLSGHPLSV